MDEVSSRLISKKVVGKVQPEKSQSRSEYNFEIRIDCGGYEIQIDTMGSDYIKVVTGDSYNYYEVEPDLYDYIRDVIFKLSDLEE